MICISQITSEDIGKTIVGNLQTLQAERRFYSCIFSKSVDKELVAACGNEMLLELLICFTKIYSGTSPGTSQRHILREYQRNTLIMLARPLLIQQMLTGKPSTTDSDALVLEVERQNAVKTFTLEKTQYIYRRGSWYLSLLARKTIRSINLFKRSLSWPR